MLDVSVWLDREEGYPRVRHSFYEKPITSPLVFHGRGACASRQKIVTLAEEIKRRMLNMDTEHTKEERLTVIRKFIQKMVDSSYTTETRREILASGITRYYRLVLQDMAGKRNLYRTSEEMKGGRERKSLIVKTWFKTQRGGSRVSEDKDFPEARGLNLSETRKKPETGTGSKEGQSRESRAERTEEGKTGETDGRMVRVVETPVFIPYTKDSTLRKRLQARSGDQQPQC